MKNTLVVGVVAIALAAVGIQGVSRAVNTFSDDDGNLHESDIEGIAAASITEGCAPDRYCPTGIVTRAQMASFLARALELVPSESGPFVDLDDDAHRGNINALAFEGITEGCAPERFCPHEAVSRAEMASLLTRALGLPPGDPDVFSDVSFDNPHRESIGAIARAGVTNGCDPGLFCPDAPVRRDQMASFLSRAFGLNPVGDDQSEVGAARIRLAVNAKPGFDQWTESPSVSEQERMRSLYETMVVRSPYFDERLSWYPEALAYIDLYAIYTDRERDDRADTHPEWILRDGSGNELYIDWGCGGGGCPQYAADVGHPGFRSDLVDRVRRLVELGYAGVLIDDVNMEWRIADAAGNRVIPIDPRTGKTMTLQDWRRYVAEFVERIRAEFPAIDIMHNAIWYADSPEFDDPYIDRQIAAADWIMLERGATDGGLVGGFESKWSVHTLFEYVDTVHALGAGVFYLDESAETLAEHEFNLAAYLLTSNGSDLVGTEDYGVINPDHVWEGFTVDLGDALGPRYQWSGVTRRDFSGGMVLLADPGTSRTVVLPEGFTTLAGERVTTVSLTARSAAVLVAD